MGDTKDNKMKDAMELINYIVNITYTIILLCPNVIKIIKSMPSFSETEILVEETEPSSIVIFFNDFISQNYKYLLLIILGLLIQTGYNKFRKMQFIPAFIVLFISLGIILFFTIPSQNEASDGSNIEVCDFNPTKNNIIESDEDKDDSAYCDNIDYYIQKCYQEIISEEELNNLTNNELYYIRNGIFAYSGMIFSINYYERYSWYNGHIQKSHFKWNMLNKYQQENIENIKEIENQRK